MELTRSSDQKKRQAAEDYLSLLVSEIHTVVAATCDDEGRPVTCAIDMMAGGRQGLYFLTAKGKAFFRRLRTRPFIALTGLHGRDTMSSFSISVRGFVEEAEPGVLEKLLELNSYMYGIYPTEEARKALAAFRIYRGTGEFFDLSVRPVMRRTFSFGCDAFEAEELFITDSCTGCGRCLAACPQQCIDASSVPLRISNENCLMCGNCLEICPHGAVIRRECRGNMPENLPGELKND